MCHILVSCKREINDAEEKKEFQELKRRELLKTKTNPIIQFFYGDNKKITKITQKYLKRHPRAVIIAT